MTRTLQKILRLASCIQKYVPGEDVGVNIFQDEDTKFLLTQTGLIIYSESVDPPEELLQCKYDDQFVSVTFSRCRDVFGLEFLIEAIVQSACDINKTFENLERRGRGQLPRFDAERSESRNHSTKLRTDDTLSQNEDETQTGPSPLLSSRESDLADSSGWNDKAVVDWRSNNVESYSVGWGSCDKGDASRPPQDDWGWGRSETQNNPTQHRQIEKQDVNDGVAGSKKTICNEKDGDEKSLIHEKTQEVNHGAESSTQSITLDQSAVADSNAQSGKVLLDGIIYSDKQSIKQKLAEITNRANLNLKKKRKHSNHSSDVQLCGADYRVVRDCLKFKFDNADDWKALKKTLTGIYFGPSTSFQYKLSTKRKKWSDLNQSIAINACI